MSQTLECTACGWQGKQHGTDCGHCCECDGECLPLSQIYSESTADVHGPTESCEVS